MTHRTVIGVGIVIHNQQVLVGKRAERQALSGYDEFPGGKLVPGESLEDTVQRECREETGLVVDVLRLVHACDYDYPHGQLALSFFDCRPSDPDAVPRAPFRWVPVSQLPSLRFPPANEPILALIAKGGIG